MPIRAIGKSLDGFVFRKYFNAIVVAVFFVTHTANAAAAFGCNARGFLKCAATALKAVHFERSRTE